MRILRDYWFSIIITGVAIWYLIPDVQRDSKIGKVEVKSLAVKAKPVALEDPEPDEEMARFQSAAPTDDSVLIPVELLDESTQIFDLRGKLRTDALASLGLDEADKKAIDLIIAEGLRAIRSSEQQTLRVEESGIIIASQPSNLRSALKRLDEFLIDHPKATRDFILTSAALSYPLKSARKDRRFEMFETYRGKRLSEIDLATNTSRQRLTNFRDHGDELYPPGETVYDTREETQSAFLERYNGVYDFGGLIGLK